MKILVTERISKVGLEYLRNNEFIVDTRYGISRHELLEIIGEYDSIIVRSVTKIDNELIDRGKVLKVIGRAGTGIDNIDVDACMKKGIVIVNTPGSNAMAAAELAVALTFSTFRNISQAHMGVKNNDFRRNLFLGNELNGKTAGIIGLGRIGSIVATMLKGCNMNVIAYDPYIDDDRFNKYGVIKCGDLEELLKSSDLISLHVPRTDETYGMIGEKELNMCKKGVRIINTARGGLVDEHALYIALKEKQVAAAGIDVFDFEPDYDKKPEDQKYENPLMELDNIIITPHLGASTEEAFNNVSITIAKLVVSAFKQNDFYNEDNMTQLMQ